MSKRYQARLPEYRPPKTAAHPFRHGRSPVRCAACGKPRPATEHKQP